MPTEIVTAPTLTITVLKKLSYIRATSITLGIPHMMTARVATIPQ